jgi:hypothetical protein
LGPPVPRSTAKQMLSAAARGLMWDCVSVGMAQTKQVVRVGRRA